MIGLRQMMGLMGLYSTSFHLPLTQHWCIYYTFMNHHQKKKKHPERFKQPTETRTSHTTFMLHFLVHTLHFPSRRVQMAVHYKPIRQPHTAALCSNHTSFFDINTVLIPLTHKPSNHRANTEKMGENKLG